MVDWSQPAGVSTAQRYERMARGELHGVSPSYEAICLGVAADAELLARLDELPAPRRQPNLLLAAVRFLDGPTSSWPRFREFALERWAQLVETMLAHRTQTNEPARCATLLPALPAGPIALLEVGAAAGLCLYPDRYAYRWRGADGEHRLGDSPATFDCALSGPVPLPRQLPEVVWRAGLDLNPLDVTDDEDVRWLESLVWPEQLDRFETLRAAVRVVRAEPPRIERGDLTTDLPRLVSEAPPDVALVIFHSAVLAYVPEAGRGAFVAEVRALARQRPLVWLANEGPGVLPETGLAMDGALRFVLARDGVPVARTGPHGQCLDWLTPG